LQICHLIIAPLHSLIIGEKLNSADVDNLVQGMEDSNGMINYEGTKTPFFSFY